MDEQENLLYFDKDDRLTYRGNGTPKRLSGTGDTEGKAKSAYRAKCVAILQAGYYTKTRSKTTQELVREIPTVASPHDGRVYLSPSNPDGVCYYLIEWLKKIKNLEFMSSQRRSTIIWRSLSGSIAFLAKPMRL